MEAAQAVAVPQETGNEYRVGRGRPPLHTQYGQPGANPGNPGGRPKGCSIRAPLLRMLAEGHADDPNGEGVQAKLLASVALIAAQKGEDITPILKLMERTDGKEPDKLEHDLTMRGTLKVLVRAKAEIPGWNGVDPL